MIIKKNVYLFSSDNDFSEKLKNFILIAFPEFNIQTFTKFEGSNLNLKRADIVFLDATHLEGIENADFTPGIGRSKWILINQGIDIETSESLIEQGYAGTVSRTEIFDLLIPIVHSVLLNELWFPRIQISHVIKRLSLKKQESTGEQRHSQWDNLTEREKELARLILNGARNKEIARQLDISVNTVKRHVSKIFNKLNVDSRNKLHSELYYQFDDEDEEVFSD